MERFKGENARTGTFNELWFNDRLLSSAFKFTASTKFTSEKINVYGGTDYKCGEPENDGTIELYESNVDSDVLREAYEAKKAGKDVRGTIMTKVVNGTGDNVTRRVYKGVDITEFVHEDWNRGQVSKRRIPIRFSEMEYLD